jgi:surface antigen
MQQACTIQYGKGLTAVATNANSAYSWQCQGPGVSRGINVTAECAVQYGNGAVADVTNPDSAWSWYCHWSVGRTVTSNTGAAGQCVFWALNAFHQYDGLYPNTVDTAANNGNAMYLAANAAFNGWTVSSTPRANSIAVFQPGVDGAGRWPRRVGDQRVRPVHHDLGDGCPHPVRHRHPHLHPGKLGAVHPRPLANSGSEPRGPRRAGLAALRLGPGALRFGPAMAAGRCGGVRC